MEGTNKGRWRREKKRPLTKTSFGAAEDRHELPDGRNRKVRDAMAKAM
jgi:hypothetical protein